MNDRSPKKLKDDYHNPMPYAQVIESLRDSNSFRNLAREILLENIKSQDVQKAITDSLKDYAPFYNFVADSAGEGKLKSRKKSLSRFFNFSFEQIIVCVITLTGTFFLGYFLPIREASNQSDFTPLTKSSTREAPLVSENAPDPKLGKEPIQ